MKKLFIILLAASCLALLGGWVESGVSAGAAAGTAQTVDAQPAQVLAWLPGAGDVASADYIGDTAAKAAALKHAGLDESDVFFLTVKLDYDDGRAIYEVEFYSETADYEYEIDARTGSILACDYDYDGGHPYKPYGAQPPRPQPSGNTNAGEYIGKNAAKAAALSHAGVKESAVIFTKVKFDYDDGMPTYDIEFIAGNLEYDVELNARTGAIVDYDVDYRYS